MYSRETRDWFNQNWGMVDHRHLDLYEALRNGQLTREDIAGGHPAEDISVTYRRARERMAERRLRAAIRAGLVPDILAWSELMRGVPV